MFMGLEPSEHKIVWFMDIHAKKHYFVLSWVLKVDGGKCYASLDTLVNQMRETAIYLPWVLWQ